MSPRHDYCCPVHKKFEITVLTKEEVPPTAPCPVMLYDGDDDDAGETIPDSVVLCGEDSPWVPPTVSFPGGPTTGAKPPRISEDNDA